MRGQSLWQLMAEKKALECSKQETLLQGLQAQYRELAQRAAYVDEVVAEYESLQCEPAAVQRIDVALLAGRQYLVQLMNMKNAIMAKQADLLVQMDRIRLGMLGLHVEKRRFEKVEMLKADESLRAAENVLRREEDEGNLAIFNHGRRRS